VRNSIGGRAKQTHYDSRVGAVPQELAAELKTVLGLRRAVETGTYRGGGARALAGIFDQVVTIELSEQLFRTAADDLTDCDNVTCVLGDSCEQLGKLAAEAVPTLYWLDAHWSGAATGGAAHECPVLGELEAIGAGHPSDCVLIDDARLFAAAPPPPHKADDWPRLMDVLDALRAHRPRHHVTVLHDLVFAVPPAARPAVDAFGRRPPEEPPRAIPQLLARFATTAARRAQALVKR
jgi:hypothetical protein